MESRFLTTREGSAFLNVTEKKVRRMLRDGELPGLKLGDEWRLDLKRLETLLDRKIDQQQG